MENKEYKQILDFDFSKNNILITAVGAISVGGQILQAFSFLRKRPKIFTTDTSKHSEGLYWKDSVPAGLLPLASSPDYTSSLIDMCEKNGIDAVFPGCEPELFRIARDYSKFKKAGITMIMNDPDLIKIQMDKLKMDDLMRSCNIPTPTTSSGDKVSELVDNIGYPIQVKARYNAGGSRGVRIIANDKDLKDFHSEVKDLPNYIAQEYMPYKDNEFTVGILSHKDKSIIDSIAVKRILEGMSLSTSYLVDGKRLVNSSGLSQGYVKEYKDVRSQSEKYTKQIGSIGPFNLQGRLIDGVFKIFECHFRFSGTTSIRSELGFNGPAIMLAHYIHGLRFGRQEYKKNILFLRRLKTNVIDIEDIVHN